MKRPLNTAAIGLLMVFLSGGYRAMADPNTRLENLKQAPFETTMMGVIKGVADYHDLGLEAPMVFGLSGHAFMINIHTGLCPSGPYCWKRERINPLIENMGLRITDLGFFGTGAPGEDRTEIERNLCESLDKKIPCSLMNMEFQIIDGYDENGFFTAQPWPCNSKYPPATLSFGSWKEFGEDIHANFYTIEKIEPADRHAAILASLDYAVDLWKNPSDHNWDHSGVGPKADDNWIAAVPTEGSGHGNFWNATVWSECRRMAADYFSAIANDNPDIAALCTELSGEYLKIAEYLGKAHDNNMDPDEKMTLLRETKQLEEEAIKKVEQLAGILRAQ